MRKTLPAADTRAATRRARPRSSKGMRFEKALSALRLGHAVRRRAWHAQSKIIRVDQDVFVSNVAYFGRSPVVWKPYAEDFLAADWVLA